MVRPLKLWIACLLALAATAAVAAADPPLRLPPGLRSGVVYRPLELDLFANADRGQLNRPELLRAALVAGGLRGRQSLDHYLDRYEGLVARLRRLAAAEANATDPFEEAEVQRATLVFHFMHREILTGRYDINYSQLDRVFDTGHYNCVSATILFNCLAAEVGLETSGGELPAHVLSLVKTPRGPLQVETTCPGWFELEENGSRPTPAADPKRRPIRRELRPVELVAMVYYNRGVDLSESHHYAEAVAANYKALRLDPASPTARGNLLAAVNNWALDLAERHQFAAAIDLLRDGRRMAPEHQTFAVNLVALHQQWVQRLCQHGRYAEATSVLDRAAREFPGERYYESARQQVYQQWGKPLLESTL